jgi:hypothetical protein
MAAIGTDAYEAVREDANRRSVERSAKGRDISTGWPGWGDTARRGACRLDLRLFFLTYFPAAFCLPFCPDHMRVIDKLQAAVLVGGLFAQAMPRGFGKTTLNERAMLWALLYRHRRYGCVIGATERDSRSTLRDIRMELLHNELLAADFPDVCYPFRATNGQTRLCGGQLWGEEQTLLTMAQDELIFASIPPADETGVAGSVLSVRAITGSIRGQHSKLRDGTIIRPDFVLLDDPQTRESAKSLLASDDREKIILGDVLGLGGTTTNVTAAMTCTVIYKGDIADRFLDRAKHPEWQGERTKMVYAFPTAEVLWDEYRAHYTMGLRDGSGTDAANAFYRENREAMDDGAVVAWPESYPPGCESAIQFAMNLRALDLAAFLAERQNEPMEESTDETILTPEIVLGKANGLGRGVVPMNGQHLTAFIDLHDRLLYWMVAAWTPEFTGQVVDYGTYPKQNLTYFSQATAGMSMSAMSPGSTDDAYILMGLTALSESVLSRGFVREDGVSLNVGRLLVDAHWSQKTDLVKTFCRRHPQGGRVVLPSFGVGLGARSQPWDAFAPKPGTQTGLRWRIMPEPNGNRHITIDVNWWKSFVCGRVALPLGTQGGIELFKDKPGRHVLLADHLCSEKPVRVQAKGREVTEWEWTPSRGDNHWFDCLVGCAVGASMLGAQPPGIEGKRKKVRRTLAEMKAAVSGR